MYFVVHRQQEHFLLYLVGIGTFGCEVTGSSFLAKKKRVSHVLIFLTVPAKLKVLCKQATTLHTFYNHKWISEDLDERPEARIFHHCFLFY